MIAVLALVAGGLSFSPLQPRPSAAAESPLRLVGHLPTPEVDPTRPLLVEPKNKQLMYLNQTSVDFYDPYTLKKTASVSFSGNDTGEEAGGQGFPLVYAWTPGQARLYVLVYGPSDTGTHSAPLLAIIDPSAPRLESVRPITPKPFPQGFVAAGMSYYAPSDQLYLLGHAPTANAGAYALLLTAVDPQRAEPWEKAHAVGTACQKAVMNTRQAAVHRPRGSSKVYFGCGTGNLVLANEPGTPGVAAIDVADATNITSKIFSVAGSYSAGESLYDDIGNKLIMLSQGGNTPSQSAWIFDESRELVVGVVAAGHLTINGSAIDPVSGRLFVAVTHKLLVSTDRGLKIPQALEIPFPNIKGPTPVSVSFAKRLIFYYQLDDKAGGAKRLGVFEHDLPDYVEPPLEDSDRTTIDAAEASGVTDATFGGDAKAFGVRAHQIAGVNGILQNVIAFNNDYWSQSGGNLGYNDGDRSIWFARTTRARLGESEASASAVRADGDANTQADYGKDNAVQYPDGTTAPDGTEPPEVRVEGQKWPYVSAECADFGTGRGTAEAPRAKVTCDAAKAHVEASTSYEGNDEATGGDRVRPFATFGASESSTKLDRDPKLGLVVETKAEARDVVITGGPGVVARFGKITSRAFSAARGRPGTATASYERAFENVTMPGGFSCTDKCDPVEVTAGLNAVLPPKIRAELPAYEVVHTPRGARASALREPWEHQQDIVMNNVAETELEVAALRITRYDDNAVRSRLIMEFAATQANSSYSIYRVPAFGDDAFGGDEGFVDLAGVFSGDNVVDETVTDSGGEFGSLDEGGGDVVDAILGSSSRPDRFGRRLGQGLRLFLTGNRAYLLNALLWSLLCLPPFLVGRRRYLLRLMGESR